MAKVRWSGKIRWVYGGHATQERSCLGEWFSNGHSCKPRSGSKSASGTEWPGVVEATHIQTIWWGWEGVWTIRRRTLRPTWTCWSTSMLLPTPWMANNLLIGCCSPKTRGSSGYRQGDYFSDFALVCSKPTLFMYGRRISITFSSIWWNISG